MHKFIISNAVVAAKGFAVGAANVIPGVSGGTIALVTGIFEKLIHSIRSIDREALRLLFTGHFADFSKRINFFFLTLFFSGVIISIFTLARVLEYMFQNYPVLIWAYFFGLIMASVLYVGKSVKKWSPLVLFFLFAGTCTALYISFVSPATENENFLYLMLSGAVAVCSMILPGLSGSFILIIMGNYQLVAIEAINHLRGDILLPVFLGIVSGLILFSRILSWLFKSYRDQTLSLLTGFIAGSLAILWPWKDPVYHTNAAGNIVLRPDGSPVVSGYEHYIPGGFTPEVLTALIVMIAGFLSILIIEFIAERKINKPA